MPADDLKDRARRIPQELLTQGDIAMIPEIFAPAFDTGATSAWISALRRAFPDLRAIVTDEVAEQHSIAQHLVLTGTHREAYMGMPPTARRVRWHVVILLREGNDGRFTGMLPIWDRLDLLCQLGATREEEDRP